MNSHFKGLLNHLSTARATLRCVSRINRYDHPTSIFSFVRGVLYQATPSGILNALCQMMISEHVLDTQIFKNHKTKGVHQFTTFLMSKILAPVGNALMNVLYCLSAFCPLGCSLLCLREFALCFRKFFFISAEETRIINSIPTGEPGKTGQAHIYPDCQIIDWLWLRLHLAGKASIPISNCIPSEGERFYLPLDRAMQNDLQHSNFGEIQTVLQQFKTKLFEGETIVPTITPKTRITSLLSRLHSPKECLKARSTRSWTFCKT